MTAAPTSKRVAFQKQERPKCSHSCPRLIYDDPHTFRVRSERLPSHPSACLNCLNEAKRKRSSSANIQYQQRCSRLPPTPIDPESVHRPRTVSSKRTSNVCTWDNFMNKKSPYAIQTPYALCDLTDSHQDLENRPPFVNYGGHSNNRNGGQKRTFNSLAVHQLKHHEVDEKRSNSFRRERRLRQQMENYFREMGRRKVDDADANYTANDRNDHSSTS